MKSKLVTARLYVEDAHQFTEELNEVLEEIENEGGLIRDKQYRCVPVGSGEYKVWHTVLIFYDVIPTRKVLTEKEEK